jgi:hypothetical protein
VDVVSGRAEETRQLQHARREDHRRGEQEGEAGGVLVGEPPPEPPDHGDAGAADAREEGEDLQGADQQAVLVGEGGDADIRGVGL